MREPIVFNSRADGKPITFHSRADGKPVIFHPSGYPFVFEVYNSISMPLLPTNTDPTAMFPNCVWSVFYATLVLGTNSSSVVTYETNLKCKEGYVMACENADYPVEYTIPGTSCSVTVDDLTVMYNELNSGYGRLVGAGSVNLDITGTVLENHICSITFDTANFIEMLFLYLGDNPMTYTNWFSPSDIVSTLEIGKGYFMAKP